MRILLHLLLFTCLTSSTFAQIKKSDLVGDWVKYKAERVDGSRIIDRFDSESSKMRHSFTYNKFTSIGTTLDYSLVGRKLSIGKFTKYIVEKLKNDTLILAENYPRKRKDQLNRLFFVKNTISSVKEPEVMEDGLIVVNKNITKTLSKNINSYLFKRISSKFGDTNFKGYMIINHLDKNVTTFVIESIEANKRTLKAITIALNESYSFWDVGNEYDKLRVNFFCKTKSVESFRNCSLNFAKSAYKNFNYPSKIVPTAEEIKLSGEYFKKGNNAFKKKKYKSAIKNFTKSYNLDYVMIDAVYNRALVHHTMGNLEKACEDWKHLADLGQKDAMKYLEQYCK